MKRITVVGSHRAVYEILTSVVIYSLVKKDFASLNDISRGTLILTSKDVKK